MSRFFVIPDPSNRSVSICLMAFDTEDYICRVSKDPLFFEAEPKLTKLIFGKASFIKSELERAESIDIFCRHLFDLIFKLRPDTQQLTTNLPSNYFRKVIEEIRNVGWDKVELIDPTLSFFEVVLHDAKNRKIQVRFDLPPSFPLSPPTVTSNLPVTIPFDWMPHSSTLVSIIDKYNAVLPSFDLLWTQLEGLDQHTFVIEPRKPSLSCCMRLLFLSPQLWLQIEIKPLRPSWRPVIKFKGADQVKREMQQKFEENLSQWDANDSVRTNIEKMIGQKLPEKGAEHSYSDIECPICFCERYGGELPEVVCENPKCAKHYHRSCLLDWLRENRKMEQSFNVIYGACPNCGTKIQCDISN